MVMFPTTTYPLHGGSSSEKATDAHQRPREAFTFFHTRSAKERMVTSRAAAPASAQVRLSTNNQRESPCVMSFVIHMHQAARNGIVHSSHLDSRKATPTFPQHSNKHVVYTHTQQPDI